MSTRKNFLTASLVTASLAPSALLSVQGEAIAQSGQLPEWHFDQGRFRRAISRAANHRHMFAAGSISGGAIVTAMFNTFYVYERTLKTPDSQVFMTGVLYHGLAVALALNDRAWSELLLPALSSFPPEFRNDVRTLGTAGGNPVLHGGANQSLPGLVSRGSVFFVCRNALAGVAGTVAHVQGRSPADVYAQISGSLVKGTMIVPTGVWAIHALQEARFTYLQTSL
jgi:intracellular sulfur oxidation DsrE/DsrF family protein